jgi:hypothetical protein
VLFAYIDTEIALLGGNGNTLIKRRRRQYKRQTHLEYRPDLTSFSLIDYVYIFQTILIATYLYAFLPFEDCVILDSGEYLMPRR